MPLTLEQQHSLEQALRQRRGEVLAELRDETRAEDGSMALPTHRSEAGDEAATDAMDAVDIAQALRDASELQRIDLALQRMETGQYGICLDCGEDIGLARLRAEPSALRCTACQLRHEKTYAGD